MESTNIASYRQPAIYSLAMVGFISLIGLGVLGAIYSSRYVPNVSGSLGAAAVYVGSIFSPTEDPTLSVVSTDPSTIISFGDTSTTTDPSVAVETASTTATSTTVTTTAPRIVPAPVRTFVPTQPSGLADLTVELVAVGYLNTSSIDSFVASPTVPDDKLPAVKFAVVNKGTNWSGTWRFEASIPARTSFNYTSGAQASIGPNTGTDFVLGYDRAKSGEQQSLTITVNKDRTAVESNYANNVGEFKLNVE